LSRSAPGIWEAATVVQDYLRQRGIASERVKQAKPTS
jgi:hypothetical protein